MIKKYEGESKYLSIKGLIKAFLIVTLISNIKSFLRNYMGP